MSDLDRTRGPDGRFIDSTTSLKQMKRNERHGLKCADKIKRYWRREGYDNVNVVVDSHGKIASDLRNGMPSNG